MDTIVLMSIPRFFSSKRTRTFKVQIKRRIKSKPY